MSGLRSFDEWAQGLLPVLDELVSLQSPQRIMHNIVEQLVKSLKCKTCAIVQINPVTDILEIRNFHNLSWQFCKNFRKQIFGSVLRDLIWKSEPVYIPLSKDAPEISEEMKLENDFVSCFAVQLSANHQPLGYFYLDSDEEDFFDKNMQYLITIYSRIISMCIFTERMTEKLKRLESEDSESGAMRYEQFYPRLQELFHRSHRLRESLSLILLDIARYSTVIQTYGLDLAKLLLKDFVRLLTENLRPYDTVTRFGADKFLIVLQGTDSDVAYKVTQRLRDLIDAREFTDQKLKLTVSVGISNYPDNSSTLDGLLNAAKYALLESKRHEGKGSIASTDRKFE